MKNYDTLSEATNDLFKQGYTLNFNIRHDHLECPDEDLRLHPEEFTIDAVYRFEGMTDPGDENILFAISSVDGRHKGLLVNAYGVYSEPFAASLAQKLQIRKI